MTLSNYAATYAQSLADPIEFWRQQALAIDWIEAPQQILDSSQTPIHRWFPDATVNLCHNAIDRHVHAGRGERVALHYASAMTGTQRDITYSELLADTARLAGVLHGLGVAKGDRVIIYMPMVPECVVAMLACARIGAVHSVVFGGFAPRELATRISHAEASVIITATCGYEPNRTIEYLPLVKAAIDLVAHPMRAIVVHERPERGMSDQEHAMLLRGQANMKNSTVEVVTMAEAIEAAAPMAPVPVRATDPLYILYTSGTTGDPKGVIRDTGGYMVALKWSMEAVFGVTPDEVMFTASDVGWVVGHSYIVYAPLLHGCASVMYEGKPVGTPDAGVLWRMIERYKVASFFTAPTAFRALKRADPDGTFAKQADLSAFRHLFLAGERSDTDTIQWAESITGVPVIDHWWQTETGWPMVSNYAGLGLLPIKYGSPTKPVPGWDIAVLDDAGKALPAGEMGEIAVRLPMPPGALPGLWRADDRFHKTYLETFPGYYRSGDAGYLDDDGYLYVMARTDDVINVAGHRLSTGAMEEVLGGHPAVAESAVVGIDDALKGQMPLAFVVLKRDSASDQVPGECVKRMRDQIGAVAALKTVLVVDRLPKTRSGKILRAVLAKMASGKAYKAPPTIEDETVLDDIRSTLVDAGVLAAETD
ncbi:MAG: AMP-binding protein [Alphaproteobacteria bacterium]|nr:AMP-binding protein [Alphaproteobacteria bacterium]